MEPAMNWILTKLETWQARLATGIAMMSALAAFFWPEAGWEFDWPAFSALIASVLLWLLSTLKGAVEIHPSDVQLFTNFRALVTDAEREFLKEYDFATPFHRDRWRGVKEVSVTWDDPRHDFIDRRVQAKWKALRAQLVVFRDLVVGTTAPLRGSDMQTVWLRGEGEDNMSAGTREEARALNAAASKAVELLDEFEHTAARRLRT